MSIREHVSSNKLLDVFTFAKSKDFLWILSFAVLTAIGAQIAIPVQPVPFTFQTMFVVLSGAFLGSKNGAYSQFVYLFLGCIGLPVFAQTPDFSIGIVKLFGPTGGSLLAFPLGAFIPGTFYLHDFYQAFELGAALFSVWMIAKIIAASTIYFSVKKIKKSK